MTRVPPMPCIPHHIPECPECKARIAALRKPARPTLRYAAVLAFAALVLVAAVIRYVVIR
jgi:hypothetical protein